MASWVTHRARGRGIATRALELIREHYRDTGLWLTRHPENVASQRVAEGGLPPRRHDAS
jgi:RimJ/RimL family protein N-acetyltransferase